MATPGRAVFGRYTVFNLASVVNWRVITTAKQWKIDIDNVQETSMRVVHDYTTGHQIYVEIIVIYYRLDYRNKDYIEPKNYLQTVHFESNGEKFKKS